MMTRDEVIANMLGALSSDVLGVSVVVDGVPTQAVKKNLPQEEAMAFAGGQFAQDGLLVEGIRLTVDVTSMVYPPVVGGEMVVDGPRYDIKAVAMSGNKWRITLLRYLT